MSSFCCYKTYTFFLDLLLVATIPILTFLVIDRPHTGNNVGDTGGLPPPSQPSTASGSGGGEASTQIGGEAAAAPKRDASNESHGDAKRPRFLDDETLYVDIDVEEALGIVMWGGG